MKPEKLHRQLEIEATRADDDSRTVEASLSSTEPVQRHFGYEVLDHRDSAIDMTRASRGLPLLRQHDPDQHVGVVEQIRTEGGKLRGRLRFSASARGRELYQDVKDGIVRDVSVGYMVEDMEQTGEREGVPEFTITRWQPLEASMVAIPADHTVGVGRSQARETLTLQRNSPMEDPAKAERERCSQIHSLGEKFEQRDLARQFVEKGESVDAFRSAVLDRMGSAAPIQPVPDDAAEIGLSGSDVRRYSFVRLLNALANPQDRRAQEAAAFEFECSEAAGEKRGRAAQGTLVPVDVMRSREAVYSGRRDMTVGSASAGGDLVATDLLADSFIELLRNASVTMNLGSTTLPGLVGDVAIPRQTGSSTAYWVAENGAPTESDLSFDQVTLAPHTVGSFTDLSRRLLKQSTPDAEMLVRNDFAQNLALEIDRAAIEGAGTSNEPQGIKNTTGIQSKSFAAAGDPTWAELVDMESLVAADNALVGLLGYAVDPTMRGTLKTKTKVSSDAGAGFIWEPGGRINSYKAFASAQVTANDVFFGNWRDLLIGMWGGLDLMADPYSNSTTGAVRIVALQDVDIAVRHATSFALGS